MKIACLSDWHLTNTAPEKRIDNYEESVFRKYEFVLKHCDDNGIKYLVGGGDIFNHPRMSLGFVSNVIKISNRYNVKILVVAGQHDLFWHNYNLNNTPLGLLKNAGVVTMLGDEPLMDGNIHFYGAGWEQPIPKIIDKNAVTILAIHIMTIKDKKVYEQQEDYITAGSLLKNNPFDLIVSGDNHQTFTELYKGRRLVNSGSLMRSTVAQKGHNPSFFVYDTDDKTLEQVLIPCLPAHEVLLINEHEESKELNQRLILYKNALTEEVESDFNFVDNIKKKLKLIEVNDRVKEIIGECV